MNKFLKIVSFKLRILERWVAPFVLLLVRLYVGQEFWVSGQNKLGEGFSHAKSVFNTLFKDEWESHKTKHWIGLDITFPVPPDWLGGFGVSYAEMILAVLLVVGLAGRAAAFGIFMIALTIELFVYPDTGTPENHYWMLLMAIIVSVGPGKLSLDYFIRKKMLEDRPATVDVH